MRTGDSDEASNSQGYLLFTPLCSLITPTSLTLQSNQPANPYSLTMSNIATTLAKHLGIHIISLHTTFFQQSIFPKPRDIDIDTAKRRTADWEAALHLNIPNPNKPDGDDDDNNSVLLAQMTTYSAFDPGASHRLLVSGALPLSLSSPASMILEMERHGAAADVVKFESWPYSLSKCLQPRVNTTYNLMCGDGLGQDGKGERAGVLQGVLYGVAELGDGEMLAR
jgi:hypothetical protein